MPSENQLPHLTSLNGVNALETGWGGGGSVKMQVPELGHGTGRGVTSTGEDKPLKAPFPWMGGKSRVADYVWQRLGNVDNYVEPFAGSLAVLLRRPAEHFSGVYRIETTGDLNHYIVNVWRAIRAEPEKVAEYADWPVTECDLHARHRWLVRSEEAAEWREKMRTYPGHYDAKIAGWYVWGACCWIGSGWCSENPAVAMPECNAQNSLKASGEGGVVARPQISDKYGGGRGVNGRPQLTDAFDIGRGVNASSELGTCDARRAWLVDWMKRLSDRLRLVRTCYGHWSRICDSDSTLTRLGTTGVFLDPPYPANRGDTGKVSRDKSLYATDRDADLDALRDEVLAWCRKWGGNPQIRIAVCGYEGDGYEALVAEGWSEYAWEASGGYANQRKAGQGKAANAKRERIWFNASCEKRNEGLLSFFGD